jgi:hypothetical protein
MTSTYLAGILNPRADTVRQLNFGSKNEEKEKRTVLQAVVVCLILLFFVSCCFLAKHDGLSSILQYLSLVQLVLRGHDFNRVRH